MIAQRYNSSATLLASSPRYSSFSLLMLKRVTPAIPRSFTLMEFKIYILLQPLLVMVVMMVMMVVVFIMFKFSRNSPAARQGQSDP